MHSELRSATKSGKISLDWNFIQMFGNKISKKNNWWGDENQPWALKKKREIRIKQEKKKHWFLREKNCLGFEIDSL